MIRTLLGLVILLSIMSGKLIAQALKKNKPVPERTIQVDFNKAAGALNTMFKACVGAG